MKTAKATTCVLSLLIVGATCLWCSAAETAPAKGTIKGKVTYGDPVANITVTLEGAVKKTVKTNDKGEFAFDDLPAGEYKLEAQGIAKNNNHKGSATVTLPEPPKKVADVVIKLQ